MVVALSNGVYVQLALILRFLACTLNFIFQFTANFYNVLFIYTKQTVCLLESESLIFLGLTGMKLSLKSLLVS